MPLNPLLTEAFKAFTRGPYVFTNFSNNSYYFCSLLWHFYISYKLFIRGYNFSFNLPSKRLGESPRLPTPK